MLVINFDARYLRIRFLDISLVLTERGHMYVKNILSVISDNN